MLPERLRFEREMEDLGVSTAYFFEYVGPASIQSEICKASDKTKFSPGDAVTFPSGESLRVVKGPDGLNEEHYDPNNSGNPLLDTGGSNRLKKLSKNFTVGEFAKSGGKTFDTARIDPKLVQCLQRLRDNLGKPITITSGYRSFRYNSELYRKRYKKEPTRSQHISGRAVDIKIAGLTGLNIAKAAIDACGCCIGIGLANTYAHIDVRGTFVVWPYAKVDKSRIEEVKRYCREQHRRGAEISKPSAPGLLRTDTMPPGQTIYTKIDLGIGRATNRKGIVYEVRPMTGIFIPENYAPRSSVDLILYLHGYKSGYPGDDASIDAYWDSSKFPFFALREGVNQSGKNVILVAPTLGPKSQAGNLVKPGWFDKYLDTVMAALKAHGPYKNDAKIPAVGKIILACHSGGGSPMRQLAFGNDRYTRNNIECWGFDSLYVGIKKDDSQLVKDRKVNSLANAWANWAGSHRNSRLFVYHLYGEPKMVSERLKSRGISNVFVYPSTARSRKARVYGKKEVEVHSHFWVPIEHWVERIRNAGFLTNR
jgi:uncharacterized protein YcbK (DUF882 family)